MLKCSLLAGRVAGGCFKLLLLGLGQLPTYSLSLFLSGYITESLPGIVLQIILVPLLFLALRRARAVPR